MKINELILIFPIIPIIFVFLSILVKYTIKKDISPYTVFISGIAQIISGGYIIAHFFNASGVTKIPVSEFNYSILFSMDRFKVYFVGCYLVTLCFVVISDKIRESFDSYYLRNLFLFFLAGCSGLLVTGDMFNFYVFYELMIICAYSIIAANEKFYASLKYMLFGTLSSLFFLGGVIFFYTSHGTFDFNCQFNSNIVQILMLFNMAFIIKSGFFPTSFWVPTCHGVAKSLFSVCLSAFPITTGIYGLFYFVVLPAMANEITIVITFMKILAIISIITSAVFIFFEPHLKKAVAWSSVTAMGIIGLAVASGEFEIGFIYMVMHAFYKGVFFLILDDVEYDKKGVSSIIRSGKTTRIFYVISVLFAAGIFPAFTHFIKSNFSTYFPGDKIMWLSVMFLISAGYFKFTYKYYKTGNRKRFYIKSSILGVAIIYILLKKVPRIRFDAIMTFEFILFFFAYRFSKYFYHSMIILRDLGNRYFYRNLNNEFLYVVFLFLAGMLTIR
ncbi:MAG: complex I subunit 5 family protein [Candidatus Muiribacteriota bacterium]